MTYKRPGFFTARVFNPLLTGAMHLGLSMRGSHVLAVRGRTTGAWRTTPVNPLALDGRRYLVAPRGETHWVRNLRAAGAGELRLGRNSQAIRVTEVADSEKLPVLRAYLQHWASETAKFFGLPKQPTDEQILRVAPEHPVFRIEES